MRTLFVILLLVLTCPSNVKGQIVTDTLLSVSISSPTLAKFGDTDSQMSPNPKVFRPIVENWFVSLLCTLLIVVLTLAIDQPEIRRKRAKLEQDKTEAELRNLRAQLHPHFLFNTLNTIYSEGLLQDHWRMDRITF